MQGPLLSLRDLCLLDDLPVLCASGVRSLKVEGRLKSPEYVAVVTSVYRRALDAVAQGNFRPDPVQREQLLQIFNRGGFTRGHILGAEDADLVTPDAREPQGLRWARCRPLRAVWPRCMWTAHFTTVIVCSFAVRANPTTCAIPGRIFPQEARFPASAADAKAKPGMQVARWRMPSSWSGLAHMRPGPSL